MTVFQETHRVIIEQISRRLHLFDLSLRAPEIWSFRPPTAPTAGQDGLWNSSVSEATNSCRCRVRFGPPRRFCQTRTIFLGAARPVSSAADMPAAAGRHGGTRRRAVRT